MINDLKEFQTKFGFILSDKPTPLTQDLLHERLSCMLEELDEFAEGAIERDMEKQADALVDVVYFAIGTAAMMGLPWQELWDDVHRANMAKERGITKRGFKADVIKPEGWVGPKTKEILAAAGFNINTQEVDYERD